MSQDWKRQYREAAELIERFVRGDPERGYGEWDDFTSVPLEDPFLDGVRVACSDVHDLYPPTKDKAYCSEAGHERLLDLARQVRARAEEREA